MIPRCPCCGLHLETTGMLCANCASTFICNTCGERFCAAHQQGIMKRHPCFESFSLEPENGDPPCGSEQTTEATGDFS